MNQNKKKYSLFLLIFLVSLFILSGCSSGGSGDNNIVDNNEETQIVSSESVMDIQFPMSSSLLNEEVTFSTNSTYLEQVLETNSLSNVSSLNNFSTTDLDSLIAKWDFGDGSEPVRVSALEKVKHKYEDTGRYRITVVVELTNGLNPEDPEYHTRRILMSHDYLTVNGQLKFASKVSSYKPGVFYEDTSWENRDYSGYTVTDHILGEPNSPGYEDLLTLGIGGKVELYYSEGFLDSDGKNDIYVYEGADEREPVDVYVSVDGKEWVKAGSAKGGRGIVSIEDSDNADTSTRFYYIRLVENGGLTSYPSGADIDAVGVMNY